MREFAHVHALVYVIMVINQLLNFRIKSVINIEVVILEQYILWSSGSNASICNGVQKNGKNNYTKIVC